MHLLRFIVLFLVGLVGCGFLCYGSPSISSIRSFRAIEVVAAPDEPIRSFIDELNSIRFSSSL